MKKVQFKSEGLNVVGHLFCPGDYVEGQQYPAIISSGSWTTVKEQMAGLYAEKLAHKGFITLAFDFRNYGESEGQPRTYENPAMKVEDIKSAVSFLRALPDVHEDKIAVLGICAGSMYSLMAASEDERINAVATAASWLHDAEAVKLYYGGEEGVQGRIADARAAKKRFAETGVVSYIPAISTTDESAAMYGQYDYYLNPERGAIPQWAADSFAVATWDDWLTLDPFPSAAKLDKPTLMIHSAGCVLPDYTKKYFNEIKSEDKKLVWVDTDLASPMHQFNFYDQQEDVDYAVEEIAQWFSQKL